MSASASAWLMGILVVLVGAGCGEGSSTPSTATAEAPATGGDEAAPVGEESGAAAGTDAARAEAEQLFATRCFTCHGPDGQGDGPGSAALNPKPRNFHDPAWQTSVTDDHIAKIIQFGGAAVGRSPTMPGNPDLMSKPEVVQALVAHIRRLGAEQ